jgi:hypothetical protein
MIFRNGWRRTRFGHFVHRFFGIHDVVGHTKKDCWCKRTKREVVGSNFLTASQTPADIEAFYRYLSVIAETCNDTSCNNPEPHRHGFACDVTCRACLSLTKREI